MFPRNSQPFGPQISDGDYISSADPSPTDHIISSVSVKNISAMSILKRKLSRFGEQEVLIGTIKSSTPSLERSGDDMQVEGTLKNGRATMRVELFQSSDCGAEFVCQIRGIGGDGGEAVTTVSFFHQDTQKKSRVGENNELLAIQPLITESEENLESKLESIVAGKIADLQNSLRDQLASFERATSYTPKYCRKGMGLALLESPSRYLVLDPAALLENSTDLSGIGFPPLCDTLTDGGGWVVIQRRVKGDIDFNRNWADYKRGFGTYEGDFWLGNDKLHGITSSGGTYELRVELAFQGRSAFAHYDDFFVSTESDKYRLKLGRYDGTAGDSLAYHNGQAFTTYDRDNDKFSAGNCAHDHGGGWWFNACDRSNLNGNWGYGLVGKHDIGVKWDKFAGTNSVSFAEMKIRRM